MTLTANPPRRNVHNQAVIGLGSNPNFDAGRDNLVKPGTEHRFEYRFILRIL